MRPSEILDPQRIKLARYAVGLTQSRTAEIVFPGTQENTRLVNYQRIERTGKTSPQTAIKIADCLRVAIDDLRLDKVRANELWVVSHEDDGGGAGAESNWSGEGAIRDSTNLFWELDRILKEYSFKFDEYGRWKIHAECNFNGDTFLIRIDRRTRWEDDGTEEHNSCCSITIRSCKLDIKKGLLWWKADQILSEFIEGTIKRILFSRADFVVMNGKAFPPAGAASCYRVAASELIWRDGRSVELHGEKSLMGRYQFINSLQKWLLDNPEASFHKAVNGITINQPVGFEAKRFRANGPVEFDAQISVRYGWVDSHTGVFEEAPWPEYDRTNIEARRFVCLGPDFSVENDDRDVPTFAPEVSEMGEQ